MYIHITNKISYIFRQCIKLIIAMDDEPPVDPKICQPACQEFTEQDFEGMNYKALQSAMPC